MNSIATSKPVTCPIALWKQLTAKANTLFEQGALNAALEGYECARSLALSHFDAWEAPDDAVAAVVVSFLNLSEAQACLGLMSLATQALCTVHGSLLRTAADDSLPPALREAAQRYLGETHSALVRFQHRYGPSSQVARWLNQNCVACVDAPSKLRLPAHAVLPAPTLTQ